MHSCFAFRALVFLYYLSLLLVMGPTSSEASSSNSVPQNSEEPQQPRPRRMHKIVGGYAPAPLDSPQVLEAAQFGVQTLLEGPPVDVAYSFLGSSLQQEPINFQVVQAHQQVVAGMNYKLTLLLKSSSDQHCIGAYSTTIYNQFGKLEVTNWGDEVSCDKALALLEEQSKFQQGSSSTTTSED